VPLLFFAGVSDRASGGADFCVAEAFLTQGFNWPLYILFAMNVALAKLLQERLAKIP